MAPPFASLLRGHPDLDDLVIFDRKNIGRLARGTDAVGWDLLALARSLSDRKYDLAIDLQGLLRSAMLTWATQAPIRVGFGYAREAAWLAYTHRVMTNSDQPERHAVERYLDLAEAVGCPRGPVEFRFGEASTNDLTHLDTLLQPLAGSRFAVLLPGTNWATKRWPAASYARLGERIRSELGLTPVIAGGADVVPLARQMGAGAIDLTNRTSLPQLVELLRRAALVIANDSGPMHIAAALGRPLVTIFGPTNPVRTGPYARPDTVIRLNIICSPCYARDCSHTSCMNWLTPDAVFDQARDALIQSPMNTDLHR